MEEYFLPGAGAGSPDTYNWKYCSYRGEGDTHLVVFAILTLLTLEGPTQGPLTGRGIYLDGGRRGGTQIDGEWGNPLSDEGSYIDRGVNPIPCSPDADLHSIYTF